MKTAKLPANLDVLRLDVRLTTRQAAAYLGCSVQHLRNLRCLKRGPDFERVSRTRVVYWKRELDRWNEERKQAASIATPPFHRGSLS